MTQKSLTTTRNVVTQLIYISVIGVAVAMLPGCGGGGGGGGTPAAATVDPANGDTDIPRDYNITASFTSDMDGTTIDGLDNFSLGDSGGNPIAAVVAFDAGTDVATLNPDDNLGVLRTYTGNLSANIHKMDGTSITPMSWSFTTADGSWAAAGEIETEDTNDAMEPQIAFDPDGNAIAIWHQSGDNSVWSNYFDASTGTWGSGGVLVESLGLGVAHPKIAMDNDGIGVAVWSHNVGGTQHIYTNRYTPGVGWGTEEPIEANTGDAFNPELAIDGSGNVIVVWEQPNNAQNSIWVNRYDASGGGWNTGNAVDLDGSDRPVDITNSHPHIAIDDNGDAMAVWVQEDMGAIYSVYAKYYDATGDSWGSEVELDSQDTLAEGAAIATDKDGNYIAVWSQQPNGGGYANIWANRYSSSVWGTASEIEATTLSADEPLIKFDGNGNAMAVWSQNSSRLRFNTYNFNTGMWGTDAAVESGADQASFHDFAMDSEGHALVVWRQLSNTKFSVWMNRYQRDTGWGTPDLLESDDTNDIFSPKVAIDGQGNGFAIWIQNDGLTETVFTARFE